MRPRAALTILTLALASPAAAQDEFPALHPDTIRSAAEAAARDRPPIPQTVRDIFMVAEDKQFRDRPALRSTLTGTITQWYPADSKARSLAVAAAIDRALDHEQILDWYLHGIYLGRRCYGVDHAAMAYFGKMPATLDVAQTAYLAALVSSPAHPPEKLLDRRNAILHRAAREGIIPEAQAQSAKAQPSGLREPPAECPPVN